MSKKILFCAALVLAIFAGAAQKRQVMLDRVVAVVGGSSILWSEVDEYAGELVEQRRQQGYTSDRDPHDEALEQLLMQKLLFNQALIDSVDVSYSGIAQRVEAHLQALIDDAGSIAALETKQHMPIFNVREMLRQRYEEQAYAQAMQSSVVGKIKVIPGEVERYYKKTDPDSLPTIPEQYVYAQITRFPASIKEAKQRTKERLLDMRERIIKGQTRFDIMARMYSMDGSAISGPPAFGRVRAAVCGRIGRSEAGTGFRGRRNAIRLSPDSVDRPEGAYVPCASYRVATLLYARGAGGSGPYAGQYRKPDP